MQVSLTDVLRGWDVGSKVNLSYLGVRKKWRIAAYELEDLKGNTRYVWCV